jgi:hypothetical protein
VASIYRYGLGVWGVSCAQVKKLDNLFVEFIRWMYRLPTTTGKLSILANFARRCAKCDALFLATAQLAQGTLSKNPTSVALVQDLKTGVKSSRWFEIVSREIEKRGLTREVFDHGVNFVSERKAYGVTFAQFCFHYHCNMTVGNSSDLLRRNREFGILPFLFNSHLQVYPVLPSFMLAFYRWLSVRILS